MSELYPVTARLLMLLRSRQVGRLTVQQLLHRVEGVYGALPRPSADQLHSMRTAYEEACRTEEFGINEYEAKAYHECLQEVKRAIAADVAKTVGGVALIGVGTAVVAPAIAIGTLGAIGFTGTGVALHPAKLIVKMSPGSIAAGLQSSIFGALIPTGSWFAACQAAAMGGVAVAAPVELAAAAPAIATGLGIMVTKKPKDDTDTAIVDAQGPSPEQLEAMFEGYQVARNANEFGVQEVQAETYKAFLEEVQPNGWDATTIAKVVAGTALVGAGATVVLPAIAVVGLGAVGFTSTGVAAGSLAASLQASVFGAMIPAGSWFATCQAAAMGGIAVAAPMNVAAGTAAMFGGTVLAAGGGMAGEKDENHPKDARQQEAAEEDSLT
ncbi:hypothetical protein FRB99_001792 [Tulasnella sp. 403]|nr:hypothetical protein FRB99_001792 [Tulasnella sp. 403]